MRNGKIFEVDARDYATVQDAINAAEALTESESAQAPSGVMVLIPPGDYDYHIAITKNVSLKGAGGWQTVLRNITIKPASGDVCPQNIAITGIYFQGSVTITNDAGSSVFNPDMGKWDINFNQCVWETLTAENICNISARECQGYGAQSYENCPSVGLYNSVFVEGQLLFSGDSQESNQCSNLDNEEYVLNTYNTVIPDLSVVTESGSAFPAVHNNF